MAETPYFFYFLITFSIHILTSRIRLLNICIGMANRYSRFNKRYKGEEEKIKKQLEYGLIPAWLARLDKPDLPSFDKYARRLLEVDYIPMYTKKGKYYFEDLEVLFDMTINKLLQKNHELASRVEEQNKELEVYRNTEKERRQRIKENVINILYQGD